MKLQMTLKCPSVPKKRFIGSVNFSAAFYSMNNFVRLSINGNFDLSYVVIFVYLKFITLKLKFYDFCSYIFSFFLSLFYSHFFIFPTIWYLYIKPYISNSFATI